MGACRTIERPGAIITIHIPDIPDGERERHRNRLRDAAERMLKERDKNHERASKQKSA